MDGLRTQLLVGRLTAPLWIPLAVGAMRFGFGWRLSDVREVRATYRRVRASGVPVLVCANHLTLVDSFLVAWALGSPWRYVVDPASLPWNLPERTNFQTRWWKRIGIYLMKCLPIERGADRGEVAAVLERVAWLLGRGESVLIFPEGGRSRTGRVEADSAAYGVGRIVRSVPGCRVLCVYLRGASQATWSDLPARGERFFAAASELEPKSDRAGLRGSLEVAQQIVARLREMEAEALDR